MEVKTTGQPIIKNTASQQQINLYTIENRNGTKLVVTDFGAAAVSLFVKDKNGIEADVLLGYENVNDYFTDEFYLGTIVGRYANRISGNSVKIDDHAYALYTRDGKYFTHGGKTGFNKKFFSASRFNNENGAGITFHYTSPHLEEGFPGTLQLEVIYTLSDSDEWIVEYKAVSDKNTLINLTQHAYFNLSGDLSTTIDDHLLQITASQYLPVNEIQVPTGTIAPVQNTVFDFTTAKPIGQDINVNDEQLILSNGFDHSFVLEQKHTDTLKKAAHVLEPLSGRTLDVFTTEPAVHFYSGNYLKNVAGKNGITYNERAAFCLETQHFPDAPKHEHFPSTQLKAGEEFYSKTVFVFGKA